jgi:hypothetical protein
MPDHCDQEPILLIGLNESLKDVTTIIKVQVNTESKQREYPEQLPRALPGYGRDLGFASPRCPAYPNLSRRLFGDQSWAIWVQ